MSGKKRENKRIPKYAQEEIEEFKYQSGNSAEFIKMKKLEFKLTDKQLELVEMILKNKIITVTGPPGTSKTFLACYAALFSFMNGKCKNIILSKPTEILSGTKDIGALPGTLDEKMQVYAESFLDSFDDLLSTKDFKHLWDTKVIEFKPAQFLRGRTLKNSVIIIDEYQNFDIQALKSIVTRLGRGSTMIFMGDTKQNDIKKQYVAVETFNKILSTVPDCANFKFTREDIVREKILIDIIDNFEYFEEHGMMPGTIRNT